MEYQNGILRENLYFLFGISKGRFEGVGWKLSELVLWTPTNEMKSH